MRQVLALRLDQDLKYREIATLLRISVETVKAHLFQARQRLREELDEEFGEWPE
jgi:DNA-directed RNA polymerase specialized sigma24 family protein